MVLIGEFELAGDVVAAEGLEAELDIILRGFEAVLRWVVHNFLEVNVLLGVWVWRVILEPDGLLLVGASVPTVDVQKD